MKMSASQTRIARGHPSHRVPQNASLPCAWGEQHFERRGLQKAVVQRGDVSRSEARQVFRGRNEAARRQLTTEVAARRWASLPVRRIRRDIVVELALVWSRGVNAIFDCVIHLQRFEYLFAQAAQKILSRRPFYNCAQQSVAVTGVEKIAVRRKRQRIGLKMFQTRRYASTIFQTDGFKVILIAANAATMTRQLPACDRMPFVRKIRRVFLNRRVEIEAALFMQTGHCGRG